MTEPELIPNLKPCFDQWHDLAEVGMWGELRQSLNEFATLYPDHPLIQVEASADELEPPSADSPKSTQ
ncbi:MAG: hypothetical protein M3O33_04480 [Cyanobacteriota bacterium]|nr:hypothetical protein [Cyanobacteriota bacterium]